MILATVLGSVTAPQQTASLRSHRLLVIRPDEVDGEVTGSASVAVDIVGAGPGDCVLVATGSAARIAAEARSVATDLTIVAIVDSIDLAEGVESGVATTKRSK